MQSKEIIDHIAGVLKQVDPTVEAVHLNRIDKLKTPAFSIEIIQDQITSFSKDIEDCSLMLNLIYYPPSKVLNKSLEVSALLMEIFLPTFQVGDRYFNFPEGVEARFVDEALNFVLTFRWQRYSKRTFVDAHGQVAHYDAADENKEVLMNRVFDLEKMETIETKIEKK